jgi:hypothetical protein
MPSGEVTRRNLHSGCGQRLSPVRFEHKSCGNAAFLRDSQRNAAWVLYIPDCVAEGEGFGPQVLGLWIFIGGLWIESGTYPAFDVENLRKTELSLPVLTINDFASVI